MGSPRSRSASLLAALAAAALACHDRGGDPGAGPGPRPVAAVQLRAERTALLVRDSLALTAVAVDAAGSTVPDRTFAWTSSDSTVIRVSPRGVAFAVAPGQATVTATAEGKSGAATLVATLAPVRSVTVVPATVTLGPTTPPLSAIARDSAGNVLAGRAVDWRSADTTVATVADDGRLTGVRPGRTVVTATSEGVRGEAIVDVPARAPVAAVLVRPDSVAVEVGQAWPLTIDLRDAEGRFTTGAGGPLVWSSADPAIAAVLENGLVRGVAPGRTTVTASFGGARGSATVEVFPSTPVGAIALSPETTTVVVGGTAFLTPVVTDSLGHRVFGRPLSWSTSDETRARVVAAGPYDATVATTGVGTVTVIATRDGRQGRATVRVVPPPAVARLTVRPETATVVVGRSVTLDAVAVDASGARVFVPVAWRSADSAVATVASGVGLVTARAPGVARVTAATGALSAAATITVVPAVPLPLAAVAAGRSHACGLDPAGAAYCWGLDTFGARGDGAAVDTVPHAVPGRVSGGRAFAALAAGAYHTCALDAAGAAWCWGLNASGQLGVGLDASPVVCQRASTPCSAEPVRAAGEPFRRIAAGARSTCALTAAGAAWCWGEGASGQLGTGAAAASAVAAAVAGGHRFTALAAGASHVCALADDGAAWCWGSDAAGQLGAPTTETCPVVPSAERVAGCATTPRPVAGGLSFTAIAAGGDHTCALTAAGAAYCWGANASGELGTGAQRPSDLPVPVAGGLRFTAIAAGEEHSCAIAAGGAAWCWGSNWAGQLGAGSAAAVSTVPVRVAGSLAFDALAAGALHTCGVAGRLAHCWGSNDLGQLGTGAASPPLRAPGAPVTTP